MAKKNIFLTVDDPNELIENHIRLMTRQSHIPEETMCQLVEHVRGLFKDFEYKVNDKHVMPQSKYFYEEESIALHDHFVGRLSREDHVAASNGIITRNAREIYNNFMSLPHRHEVKIIRDKGKSRVITTNHPATFLFKNSQWAVHNHLKKKNIFKYTGAQVRTSVNLRFYYNGDWILSGDYQNSTDYIPSKITRLIWRVIGEKLPDVQRRLINHSLDKEELVYPDGIIIEKKSGQLMGSLTSFGALCILNDFLCKKVGLSNRKINGDDVLAICGLDSKKKWADCAGDCGLAVNYEKSHLNPYWGTFNSQLLRKCGKGLRHVPHVSISKLKGSTLNDWLQKPTCGIPKKQESDMLKVYFKYHGTHDLLKGEMYSKSLLKKIFKYNKFFVYMYKFLLKNEILYMGMVGGMSKFYDAEDIEKMVDGNWENKFDDLPDFHVGQSGLFSVERAYYLQDWEFIKNWKMNFKLTRRESRDNITCNVTQGPEGDAAHVIMN